MEFDMKKTLLIVLLIMFNVSVAQKIVPDTSKMTNTEKMMWYQNEKKSPARAIFYSWLIPTSGHAYAGDWNRGLIFKGGELASFFGGVFLFEVSTNGESIPGAVLMMISPVILIWEFYDVAKTATKYNKQLYKDLFGEEPKMKISFIPKSNGFGLALNYNL